MSDWDKGWKTIGEMAGSKMPRRSAKRAFALMGVGMAGLPLMCFGDVGFILAVAWFGIFGALIGALR